MDHQNLLNRITDGFIGILGPSFTGLYVHGSIAFGCFNPRTSDIDFITVTENKLDSSAKRKILDFLFELLPESPPGGLEMSVVLRQYCRCFTYPTPYELHFSNTWLHIYQTDPAMLCGSEIKTDRDLAAHFTVIRHTGISWCGQPIDSVFGPVKREYYIDSILRDIAAARRDILSDPVYVILNLCRVLAFLTDDTVLSKAQGGIWALERINEEFKPLVTSALEHYRLGESFRISSGPAEAFCDFMLENINKLLKSLDPPPGDWYTLGPR